MHYKSKSVNTKNIKIEIRKQTLKDYSKFFFFPFMECNIVPEIDRKREGVLLATLFFRDYPHRFASGLSAEETSSSSQVSIPEQESEDMYFLIFILKRIICKYFSINFHNQSLIII